MRNKLIIILSLFSLSVCAATVQNDSVYVLSLETEQVKAEPTNAVVSSFKPDADKAVWLAAVVPGLGQIYNRQYWKVPIVYGGAVALVYGISWNDRRYVDYRKAYVDIMDSDPNTNYFEYFTNGSQGDKSYYTRVIKTRMDNYRRNRDLCIIASAVLYLLSIVDAYVDAQMFDYDISPDLSLQLTPTVIPASSAFEQDNSVGLSCKLKF